LNSRRYFLTIAYLGTNYHGWQVQKIGQTSVQGMIEESLLTIFNEKISVTGQGRTDAGVDAEGQTAHISVPDKLPPERLVRAVNSLLPFDIRILKIDSVHPDAHSRRDALSKTYRYQIWTERVLPPFNYYTWHILPYEIDTEVLSACCEMARGVHDFSAFTVRPHLYASCVREIIDAGVAFCRGGLVLSFTGNGFLRYMVRRLAGAMVEAARGKKDVKWFRDLLYGHGSFSGGPTLPAKGLILEEVRYPSSCYNI